MNSSSEGEGDVVDGEVAEAFGETFGEDYLGLDGSGGVASAEDGFLGAMR